MRGTPQQIIEKYNQLARDAQLSNDRVAAENFQQHAEHYTRLLGAAQKEIDAQREQQEREQQERRDRQEAERLERVARAERNGERTERGERTDQGERGDRPERTERPARRPRNDYSDATEQPSAAAIPGEGDQPDILAPAPAAVVDVPSDTDTGLVATPEEAPKPKRARAPRKPRAPRAPKVDTITEPAAEPEIEKKTEEKSADAPAAAPTGDAPEAAE